MITVFHPLDGIEAHLVKIVLAGEGIRARVAGDYLQGAIGELPAVGLLQVQVDERDAKRARDVIRRWQRQHDNGNDDWIPSELR